MSSVMCLGGCWLVQAWIDPRQSWGILREVAVDVLSWDSNGLVGLVVCVVVPFYQALGACPLDCVSLGQALALGV